MATATTTSTKPSTSTSTSSESGDSVSKALEEYVPPGGSGEQPEVTLADIRTSDDAQVMFLREEIDEELFAQAVNKYGKPSNGPENGLNRVDLAYERDLPKWAFNPPLSVGPSIKERVETAQAKEDERVAAAEGTPKDPYTAVTVTIPAGGETGVTFTKEELTAGSSDTSSKTGTTSGTSSTSSSSS